MWVMYIQGIFQAGRADGPSGTVDLQPRPPAGRRGSQRMCPSRTRLRPRVAGLSRGLQHSVSTFLVGGCQATVSTCFG